MSESAVHAYRLALDRLHDASRVLAHHFEASVESGTDPDHGDRLDAIWAKYKRILLECQQAFEHVPPGSKTKVPPPPPV